MPSIDWVMSASQSSKPLMTEQRFAIKSSFSEFLASCTTCRSSKPDRFGSCMAWRLQLRGGGAGGGGVWGARGGPGIPGDFLKESLRFLVEFRHSGGRIGNKNILVDYGTGTRWDL